MTAIDARRRLERRRALRASLIAALSSVVVLGGLAWLIANAPGWASVQRSFLDGRVFADALPGVVGAFAVNVQLFVAAEILVLIIGLGLAIVRSLPGPVFLPLRILATIYTDVFRSIPGILVIFVIGFGIPGLGLVDPKTPQLIYGLVALTLVYSAYVSEVYRAGIESVHPSQDAAARSLGLSRWQSLRHVVIPQAVRRVIPPLLNDFIGLQKDTVLVSFIGVVELFRTAQIKQFAAFNFTPYIVVGLVFLILTIPLTRLTDALIARDRRQSAAGTR
jgi:polar amino acid transport system permease protein